MTTMLRGIQSAAQAAYTTIQPTLSSIQEKVCRVWNQVKAKSSEAFTSVKACTSKVFTKLSDTGSSVLNKVQSGFNRMFCHSAAVIA